MANEKNNAKRPTFFPAFVSFPILLCFEISSFGKFEFVSDLEIRA